MENDSHYIIQFNRILKLKNILDSDNIILLSKTPLYEFLKNKRDRIKTNVE